MLRLFRDLCTVFNIISYDKHDNRTIPSDLRCLKAKRAQFLAVLWEHRPYREPFLLLEGQNTCRVLAFILDWHAQELCRPYRIDGTHDWQVCRSPVVLSPDSGVQAPGHSAEETHHWGMVLRHRRPDGPHVLQASGIHTAAWQPAIRRKHGAGSK